METSRRLFPCLFPRWAKSFLMFLGFLFLLSKPISPCEASSPLKLAGGASGHAFCVYHPSKLQFVCWGQNNYGQLGYPDTQNRGLTQRADSLPIIDLLDHFPEKNGTSLELLLPAYWNNGVLFSDGSAVLFGSDGYGQIGVNSPAPLVLLQDASLSTETFKVLAGAGVANCFATTDEPSDMICWGDDWAGGGDLRAGEGEVVQVVAGYKYVCALYQSTKTFCWGTPGAYNDKIQGEVVFGGGLYATKLFAGSAHMCAIVNDGSSRCWSYGHTGQLGYGGFDSIDDSPGHEVSSLGPIQFQDADPYSVQSMCGGVYHSCALLADHSVWCWGRDREVGTDSAVNLYNPIPLLVEFSVDQSVQAQQLECSDKATCVLFNDSSVRCWGGNSYGELGSGSVGIRSAFFAIPLDFTELVSSSSSASSSEGDPSSSSSEVPSGSDSSSSSSDGEAVALSVTFAPNSTSYTIIASAGNQDDDLEAMEVTAHFDSFVMEDHVLLLLGSWKDKGSEVDEEDGGVHHEVWVGVANSNSTLLITHHDVKKAQEQETLPGSGRSFAVGPSVKTSLRMDGWPFNFTTAPASSWTWTMSLQIPFSHRLIGFECKSIGESVEECLAASLVEGWTVRVKVVLEALVDGQPDAVTYHILPQSNSSSGADAQVVEIQFHLPAFQQNLSVLLQTGGAKGDDEEGKEKEEDPNLVVVYVLVPLFVGAVVVVTAVVTTILLRRKRARNKAHVQEKLSAGLASSI
ncbi:RCC1 domain-containing protein 1 [Balamuthia mandrillaris]